MILKRRSRFGRGDNDVPRKCERLIGNRLHFREALVVVIATALLLASAVYAECRIAALVGCPGQPILARGGGRDN